MQEVEIYSRATNAAVLRLLPRQFPGILVPGDTLSSLYFMARLLCSSLEEQGTTEQLELAEELRDDLLRFCLHYEAVLKEHGLELPYPTPISEAVVPHQES